MRISDWSSDVCSSDLGNFDRVGDELLDFDRRQTRIDGVDLHLVAGDVRHRVNRQLAQLPNAEAGDREEDEQDRPACADGERNETCNHGLVLLARALAELGPFCSTSIRESVLQSVYNSVSSFAFKQKRK